MLFVSLLLSFFLVLHAKDCSFKNPTTDEIYDLTSLSGTVMEGHDAKVSTYQYKASVCDDMKATCEDIMTGKTLNGCTYQYGGEPGGKSVCWDVLAFWDASAIEVKDLDSKLGTKGISLTFKNGDECRNNPRENTMNFICDTTVPDDPGYVLTGSQDPNDSCHFIINISSKHSCPGASPHNNGGSSGSSGLSGGWIFIILILVLPIVYFSSVFGYRGYTTKEYKNSENCPHLDLCKKFPIWVKTGCVISAIASKNGCMWLISKCKKGDDEADGGFEEDDD